MVTKHFPNARLVYGEEAGKTIGKREPLDGIDLLQPTWMEAAERIGRRK